jgi:Tol biopolymer transport system component
MRTDINGGTPQKVADATNGGGGAWGPDGTIIFAQNQGGPILRVSATGGKGTPVTRLERQQAGHRFPQFLPDGGRFIYYVAGTPENRGVYISELDGSKTQRLLDSDSEGVYIGSGQLLFAQGGSLFAQDFDPIRLTVKGNPLPVADHVAISSAGMGASASVTGITAFRSGSGDAARRQFAWVDRSGKVLETIGEPDSSHPGMPALSRDGRRVALSRLFNGNSDVWLLEMDHSLLHRFTYDPTIDNNPVWSPDGSRVIFSSNRKGVYNIYEKPTNGAPDETSLLVTGENKFPMDWSRDGRYLLYVVEDLKIGQQHLWALPLYGDRQPFPVDRTTFNEREGQFSPDGEWVAYTSIESGRAEVYVQAFPQPAGRVQVSNNGGAQPRWRPDGKELFYIDLDDRLMAVPIRVAPGGRTPENSAAVPLFVTHIGGAVDPARQNYVVTPDGKRFLMNTILEDAPSPLTLILNWKRKAIQ